RANDDAAARLGAHRWERTRGARVARGLAGAARTLSSRARCEARSVPRIAVGPHGHTHLPGREMALLVLQYRSHHRLPPVHWRETIRRAQLHAGCARLG